MVASGLIDYSETAAGRAAAPEPPPPEPLSFNESAPEALALNESQADESAAEVPEAMTGYIEPPWFGRARFALTGPGQRGACMFGPRGTGKTSGVRALAHATQTPLVAFQAAAGCTLDDLVGQRDLIDGKTIFTPGPLVEAIRQDCWLVLEEANVMHPGVFSALNTLTDGSGHKLRTPDGKRYPVGKRFRCILCFNEGGGYAGTKEVNAALRDRLMPIYCDYLPVPMEIDILIEKTGCDFNSAQSLVGLATKIRAAKASLGFDFSPRSMFRVMELMRECGLDWKDAFTYGVLDLVGDPIEKAPQRACIEQVAAVDGLSGWARPVWSQV